MCSFDALIHGFICLGFIRAIRVIRGQKLFFPMVRRLL
jgi:hypothetical protein